MNDADTIGDDDDRVFAAEYVLGLLSDADLSRAEYRLGSDPAFRAEVVAWQEDFDTLTDPMPEVAPPAQVWRGIEAALDTPMTTRPKRSGISLLGYALAGLMAAGLAWVVVNSGVMTPAAPEFQARIAAEDSALVFAAAYDVDTGELALARQTGAAATGRSLEIWLIAEGQAPVSVLVWPDASEAEVVTLPAELAANLPGAVLAISDEPLGGSPTGQPTGAVLALGPVQEI